MGKSANESKLWSAFEIINDDDAPIYVDFRRYYFHSRRGEEKDSKRVNFIIPMSIWQPFAAWFARQTEYPNWSDFYRDWFFKGFAFATSQEPGQEHHKEVATYMIALQNDSVRSRLDSQTRSLQGFKESIEEAKRTNQTTILQDIQRALLNFLPFTEGTIKDRAQELLKEISRD